MSAKHTPELVRPDQATFDECVRLARHAKHLRRCARMIRGGTSVYGWSLGRCEREARRAERTVRIAADFAIREVEHNGPSAIAKATGSAS